MQRILANQLSAHTGETVRVEGWLHRRRLLKSVAFAVVRDRSGLSQAVVTDPDTRARLADLTEETVVRVTGTAVVNSAAPDGVEIVDPVVAVLGAPAQPPPIDLYRPKIAALLPVQLDNAAVALRHPRRRAAFAVAAAAVHGFRSTLDSLGFTEVHTPKIVESATESGANVFGIDYFGTPAYLAQSPQFYKQTMVGVFERVYEVGPVFRAEPHDTVRHLAQYTSLDAELGFIADHRDVMAVVREVVAGMVAAVGRRAAGAAALCGARLPAVPGEIPSIRFADAMVLLGGALGEDLTAEPDLAPAHERWLSTWAQREHGTDLLFVTGYPMVKRPFYTHPQPGDARWSNSFDLLFRGTELCTGGQRLHRLADYEAALRSRGMCDVAPYRSYLDSFRYGMPPHGGFAIGLERFVARLTGAVNVREVTLFPRDLHRVAP